MTPIIAIDPGMNGGVAVQQENGQVLVFKLPREADKTAALLFSILVPNPSRWVAALENVPLYTGFNMRGAATGKMVGSYKFSEGFMYGCGVGEVIGLVPLKWQNLIGCRNLTGLDKTRWKGKLANFARVTFPAVKVVLWNSDALCILQAARLLIQQRNG